LARSGVDIIQLRDKFASQGSLLKEASLLSRFLKKTKTLFIVNDYLDIAFLSDSDGVHLGQKDIPVQRARRLLGKDKIIGVSCSNLTEALKAQRSGADYIGFGPVFKSPIKPGVKAIGLDWAKDLKKIKIPVFAIGDINAGNIRKLVLSGINRVALCRGILQAKNISGQAEYFTKILRNTDDSIRIRKK
jgi:thiamine-phosphate pyrophosphorylase